MDIDKNAHESEQWKRKYLDQLEEFERAQKQWREVEDLLRKTVSRLTLAADGLDDTLDRQLSDLRNTVRERDGAARLRSCVDDMSSTLLRLDKHRKRKRLAASAENPLLKLLEALSLPKGAVRQTKALKKQLASASPEDDQAVVQSLAAVINAVIQTPSEPGAQVADANHKSGFMQRLFATREKPAGRDAPQADARNVEGSAAKAAPQTADGARDILMQLLERLSLPNEYLADLEAIRNRIEAVEDGESWDPIIEQIADLIQKIRRRDQREKQGIEDFLVKLSDRLLEVDRQLQDSGQYYDESLQAGDELNNAVKKEISGIENSVREASDLGQLKHVVQTHIESVLQQMEKHRQHEQQRYQQAKAQIDSLSERLQEMESESQDLRSRVEEERNQAMTDALTGIPNRLAYEQRLDEEIARHKRFNTPLVLAVWDVDHFKKVNDRFGHRAGDKVLRALATTLRDGIRETDFVARYGGEEFVLLMTGSNLDECLPVAERLRSAVAATGFHFRGQAVTITASCGLAEFDEGETVGQWFERADKALYRAKQSGRNRCEAAQS